MSGPAIINFLEGVEGEGEGEGGGGVERGKGVNSLSLLHASKPSHI